MNKRNQESATPFSHSQMLRPAKVRLVIKEIRRNEDIIIVFDEDREQEIPIPEFVKMFNVAYCITTHRAQGMSIDEPYTIYEFELFDERLRYVALSRATDKNLINIA